MIRELQFRVGERVKTPKDIGTIKAIGQWTEPGGKFTAICYRINNRYWLGFQLSRVGPAKRRKRK